MRISDMRTFWNSSQTSRGRLPRIAQTQNEQRRPEEVPACYGDGS